MNPAEDAALPAALPAKNALLLISFQLLSKFFLAFWTFYLARKLGVENYGLWANLLATAAIFSGIQEMGTLPIFIKKISQNRLASNLYFGQAFSLFSMLSFIFLISTLAFGWSMNYSPQNLLLLALACFTYVSLIPQMSSQAVLFSNENFKPYVLALSLSTTIYIFLGFAFLESGYSVGAVLIASILGNLISGTWIMRKTIKTYHPPLMRWEPAKWWEWIVAGFPIAASGIFHEASTRADRILIQKFLGNSSVGFFHAAFTTFFMLREILLIPISNSVYPRLAKTHEEDIQRFTALFEKINYFLLIITLPLCLFFSFFSGEIVSLLFGNAFIPAAKPMAIMAWAVPPMCISTMFLHIFVFENRQHLVMWTRGLAFLFNLLSNLLFLPKWGLTGSAWSATLTQLFLLLLVASFFRNKDFFRFTKHLPRLIVTILTSAILIHSLKNIGKTIFLPIFGGLFSLISIGWVLKIFNSEEIQWLKKELKEMSWFLKLDRT